MKRLIMSLLLLLSITVVFGQNPKYIFFIIGDGMGYEHLKLEDYGDDDDDRDDDDDYYDGNYNEDDYDDDDDDDRDDRDDDDDDDDDDDREGFFYYHFPVVGSQITSSLSSNATDSAAAGTALATGQKTKNGTISMDGTRTKNLPSIMVTAKQNGWMTGVLTSVSIDHATPAAFYAHSKSRDNYHEISDWVTKTGLDIYAGAGFRDPRGNLKAYKRAGYTIFRGDDADLEDARKVVWIQQEGENSSQLPYKVDREDDDMSLPDMLEETIDWLEEDRRAGKFILMAEGGAIDWASHDNNARRTAGEVEDLIDTVEEALDFYEDHRSQTLIIVTADHETGGLYFDKNGKARWRTGGHTDSKVPVFAIGVGAENFRGTYHNTELSDKIRELLK